MGTVKAISGNIITLATNAGTELTVQVQDSTRILRTVPGRKDLREATPISLQEVQVGDRVLARGTRAEDGRTLIASTLVAMKRSDIVERQQRELQDWRARGVGGLVQSIDLTAKTVTISTLTPTGISKTTIQVTDETILRRYAPGSVKFEEAKPGTLNQIKAGDQLRARGSRNPDSTELTADEVVSGTFRNVAGTITSTDAANHMITVNDLATKKPLTVSIGPGSQMRSVPPMLAQRIAMRLKGTDAAGAGASLPPQASGAGAREHEMPMAGAAGPRMMRGGDFQDLLSHVPSITLADLKKGDVIMLVATEGSANAAPTAITLLTGVEPILTAAPNRQREAEMLLSPWNLSSPAEAGGGQ